MRYHLPLLCCTLLLLAPACMAQSKPVDEPATETDEAPRSAMGRVMGIMIEALRQEATGEAGPDAPQEIEVGAAFQLQAKPRDTQEARPPAAIDPPCDVQPCERDPIANLRIASQK